MQTMRTCSSGVGSQTNLALCTIYVLTCIDHSCLFRQCVNCSFLVPTLQLCEQFLLAKNGLLQGMMLPSDVRDTHTHTHTEHEGQFPMCMREVHRVSASLGVHMQCCSAKLHETHEHKYRTIDVLHRLLDKLWHVVLVCTTYSDP
jgi:hypothetical protein